MKKISAILIILLCAGVLCAPEANGQIRKQWNYRNFDEKWFNFGFTLGFNISDFATRYTYSDLYGTDSLQTVTCKGQPGFNLGVVTSVTLIKPVLKLRFIIPTLSFQERLFTYRFLNADKTITEVSTRVESTNLDFPVLLKLRTKRINNFAAYMVIGGQYSLDLATQKDVDNTGDDPIIKIKQHDWSGQVGGGFDFFMPYFKFGIELKFSHGFKNLLIQDNTRFARHIDKLYSKVWWISLTFEG